MSTVHHKEKIDIDNATWLNTLNTLDYEKTIWNEESNNFKGERLLKKEPYIKCSKNWLCEMIELGGSKDVKYRYSKKMATDGRLYQDGVRFGVPQCKKNLRGFLCSKFYRDYDMRNAHPTILKYILKTFYNCSFEKEYPYFNDYIDNRDDFLSKSELAKTEILVYMNSENGVCYQGFNNDAVKLCQEFKEIQVRLYNLPQDLQHYGGFKNLDTGKNKHGRFMNKMLVIFENQIINQVRDYYEKEYDETPVSSLIYDGLHIDIELEDQCTVLNHISKDYGVTWAVKEFDNSIAESDLFKEYIPGQELPPGYSQQGGGAALAVDYKSVKERMEKNCFYISKTSEYCIEEEGEYNIYNGPKFTSRVAHHKFTTYSKGYPEHQRLFQKWEEDPDKRTYYKVDFIPDLDKCPDNVYNTFTGFAYGDYKEIDFAVDLDAIALFKKQISIIVNHDEHVVDYFIKYFADMFQNPSEIPGVCLIMKSDEGWGKDLLTDLLGKLLGNDLMLKTEDMSIVFDKFNGSLKNKMLIHLNELTAKDGWGSKDNLKGKITATELNIQEKGKEVYKQKNYSRWVAATNNLTPIEVKTDSRRFVVVQADPVKPSEAHFMAFIKMMNNKESLYSIMEYLMEMDLNEFKIRRIPETEVARSMKHRNIPFIYFFMEHIIKNENYKEVFDKVDFKEKDNQIIIKKSVFKKSYETYCIENDHAWQSVGWTKQVCPLLNALDCTTRKKSRFDDGAEHDIRFNIQTITNALVNKIAKEEEDSD